MPPQVNARLLEVTSATASTGGRDDWFTPGTEPGDSGTVKWAGEAGAYYQEAIRRAGPDVAASAVLYLDSSVARLAGIDTDDVIRFVGPDGVERRARAALIAVRELAGVPAQLQTARIELADA